MDAIKTESKPALRDERGLFLEGTAPGPGRPPGSFSIKDAIRKELEAHPEDVRSVIRHFIETNRELMWQMLEGRPPQTLNAEVKGNIIVQVPGAIADKNDINPGAGNNSQGPA